MICYCCDASDWHKMPGLHSKSIIQVCKKCGVLCHDVSPEKEAEVKKFYRTSYKPTLNIAAIITAGNKLRYIAKFLEDHVKGKKGLVCADIGAATGYLANWLMRLGNKATGCEWTLANRRMSEHFHGIPLTEELSEKRKYDLLSMYHVLEHLIEPDKKLEKYVGLLADGGRFLVSTPMWLQMLEEQSGALIADKSKPTPQASFDNLFHTNHINLFSQQAEQNLFRRAGLVIVKEDLECYGQTYLLRVGEKKPIEPEDWQVVSQTVLAQKKAIELLYQNKYQDAVKAWPLFPEGWAALVFGVYGKDPERQADMLQTLPPRVRSHWRIRMAEARWLAQMNRLEEALGCLNAAMEIRFQVEALFSVAEILTRMGKLKEAMDTFAKVAELHPHRWTDCYQLIVRNATQLETWDERAEREVKKLVFEKALAAGSVKIEEPEPVGLPEAK